MKVKELITQLLDQNMDDEVRIEIASSTRRDVAEIQGIGELSYFHGTVIVPERTLIYESEE